MATMAMHRRTSPDANGLDEVIASIAESKRKLNMEDAKIEDTMEGIDSDSLSTSPTPEGMNGPPPPGSQYFSCNQCQKVFWSETSLKHHCSLYHSEKAFVCEICNKAFRFRSNLAEHRSVHTALKPYVCKFCGKSSRLKGNLTKHILKHHKKEQNAYIGKDDIIIKKGKKSVKDPAAVDFLEKSMIVLTESPTSSAPTTPSQTPNSTAAANSGTNSSAALHLFTIAQMAGAAMSSNGGEGISVLNNLGSLLAHQQNDIGEQMDDGVIGYGMDNKNTTMDDSDVMSVEQKSFFGSNSLILDYGDEDEHDSSGDSEAIACSSNGREPTSIINPMVTPTPIPQPTPAPQSTGGTRCGLCGKHFRKTQNLQLHMTLKHGHAPPGGESNCIADLATPPPLKLGALVSPASVNGSIHASGNSTVLGGDLKELKDLLRELKSVSSTPTPKSNLAQSSVTDSTENAKDLKSSGRLETLLVTLDGRVGRLEKQVETSLSSLYTLVQLQSTMNTAFTRFRDDVTQQLTALQALKAHDSFE